MNNKEKGDIKTPEEILRNGKHLFEDQVDSLNEQFGGGFVDAITGAMEEYADQFKPQPLSELSSQIESLQKELVVANEEKGRLEKEKRQLLIALRYETILVSQAELADSLKITVDEVRVSVSKADLMMKEFLK